MKMKEAICEALRRLDCVPDSRLQAAIERNLGCKVLAVEIPKGHEERTIQSLVRGMRDDCEDGHRSFPA
jgi:hypothetical protein